MVLLGWAVGPGSTLPDDWFQRGRDTGLGWLLFFTDPRTVPAILAAAVRWRCTGGGGAGIGCADDTVCGRVDHLVVQAALRPA